MRTEVLMQAQRQKALLQQSDGHKPVMALMQRKKALMRESHAQEAMFDGHGEEKAVIHGEVEAHGAAGAMITEQRMEQLVR